MTTLMFWNLFDGARRLSNGDHSRWEQQTTIVRRLHPDILAITEGWDWHCDDDALFRRALADFGYADGVLYQAKTGCDMAVFWREGIQPLETQRQPLQQAWWHGYMQVTVQLPGDPEPFVLLVSHMNPFDPTLRRIEGSFLRARMTQIARGALVMDANTVPPGDPEPRARPARNLPGEQMAERVPLESLAEIGLIDVGAAFSDRTPTFGYFNVNQGSANDLVRLDQAWATSGTQLTGYRVLHDPQQDAGIDTASDHRPIWFSIA